MYQSKYYTCEEIDERLLKGYYDDVVSKGYTGTFEQLQLELASVDLIDLNLLNDNAGYTLTEAVAKMDELSPVHPSIVRFRYTDKTYNKLRTLTYDSTKSDLLTKVTDISTYTITLSEFNGDIFKSLLLEIGHIGFEGSMYITHSGTICGKVSIFGDTSGHVVNQEVLTNCVLSSDRTSLESSHNHTKIFKYERFFNLSNSSFQDRDGNIVPSHDNSLWYTSTYEIVPDAYVVCNTPAGTAGKTISVEGYHTIPAHGGGSIKVKFTYTNTVENPTLDISGTGAKPLYLGKDPVSPTNTWADGSIVEVFYDGENYRILSDQISGMNKLSELVQLVHVLSKNSNFIATLKSLLAELEQNGFYVIDKDGYVGMRYDESGLDFAKLSEHAIQVLNEAGIRGGGGDVDSELSVNSENAVQNKVIANAFELLRKVVMLADSNATNAVSSAADAIEIATAAKNAIKTLQGLADADLSAITAANVVASIEQISQKVNKYSNFGKIGVYYPEQCRMASNQLTKSKNSGRLSFVWATDTHSNSLYDFDKFTDASPAKCMVVTGDLLGASFAIGAHGPINNLINAMQKPCYVTTGNHDVQHSNNCQEVYDNMFAPIAQHNGITNGKTYYSVVFEERVKGIFVDIWDAWDSYSNSHSGATTKMTEAQINFIYNELVDAGNRGLHVCMFIHIPPYGVSNSQNVGGTWYQGAGASGGAVFLADMVRAFIRKSSCRFEHNGKSYTFDFSTMSNSGILVSWFSGHAHIDGFGKMNGYAEQNSFSLCQGGNMPNGNIFRETEYNGSCAYITLDPSERKIIVMKLGNYINVYGEKQEIFNITY